VVVGTDDVLVDAGVDVGVADALGNANVFDEDSVLVAGTIVIVGDVVVVTTGKAVVDVAALTTLVGTVNVNDLTLVAVVAGAFKPAVFDTD
jgi:glyoxylate carboligase